MGTCYVTTVSRRTGHPNASGTNSEQAPQHRIESITSKQGADSIIAHVDTRYRAFLAHATHCGKTNNTVTVDSPD